MQRDVVAFLSSPQAYGQPARPVERIDTHISIVWLAGDRAYKLKRAVKFDYVDFSTAELRRVACEAEIQLNRRTAPSLYLGVRPVTRESDGSLLIGGTGEPIDWLVEMKRFNQETLFDRLADRGRLDIGLMETLGSTIAALHAGARIRSDHGGRAGMTWVADGNAIDLLEYGANVLASASSAVLAAETRHALCRHASRLDSRCRGGMVRECHGDLHLRNICLVDGRPTIFDGVEFNDRISCVDVLYDLAFLLMDLWRRDLRDHANAVFNEYIRLTADVDALCLMPLFLSCRAAVRAKTSVVSARMQSDAGRRREFEDAAKQYVALAYSFLHPPRARLIAIGGVSGSGKSTLALALAAHVGAAPGALLVRSDAIRKGLMGVAPRTRLDLPGYEPAVTRRVYETMADRALAALRAGHSVVADAVFARAEDREAMRLVAREAGAPFVGFWIDAPRETLARRIAERSLDISDATIEVLDRQLGAGSGPTDWHRLDGANDAATVLEGARAFSDRVFANLDTVLESDHA
jgi:aminoglycoside phosphotransferase family enzyme/predicted kinase